MVLQVREDIAEEKAATPNVPVSVVVDTVAKVISVPYAKPRTVDEAPLSAVMFPFKVAVVAVIDVVVPTVTVGGQALVKNVSNIAVEVPAEFLA